MSDLPEPDPIRADRRRARRDRRVPPDAACVLCLTVDPEILIEAGYGWRSWRMTAAATIARVPTTITTKPRRQGC
jgi:hypothetical protein